MIYRICLFLGLFSLLIGCTRKIDEKTSLQIGAPATQNQKVGASAIPTTFKIQHVVVNIRTGTSENIDRVFNWDSECLKPDAPANCTEPLPFPIEITDVPVGPNKLIQFLGVYVDTTNFSQLFSYGDSIADLGSGSNVVTIDAATFGSAGGREVNVAGQYVDQFIAGEGFGPTGRVSVLLAPPNGNPAMEIVKKEIFNGWFNFFSLEGVPFSYRLDETGEILFTDIKPETLDSLATNGSLMKVEAPDTYFISFDGSNFHDTQSGELFLGFFGPAKDSSQNICYDTANNQTIPFAYQTASVASPLQWNGTVPTAGHINRISGGTDETLSPCTIASDYVTKLPFDFNLLSESVEEAAGFRGPFKYANLTTTFCGSALDTSLGCYDNTSSIELKWNYLPNVTDQDRAMDGVTVFTRIFPNTTQNPGDLEEQFEGNDGDLNCAALPSFGFTAQDVAAPATSTTVTATYNASTDVPLIFICPFKNISGSRFYSTAPLTPHVKVKESPPPATTAYDFSTMSVLPAEFTFARASTATMVDASGDLFLAAGGGQRFTHDPLPPHNKLGLLIEDARTNDAVRSEELDLGSWTLSEVTLPDINSSSVIDPMATNTAEEVRDNSTAGGSPDYIKQSFAGFTNGDELTFSVFMKAGSSNVGTIWAFEPGVQGPSVQVDLTNGNFQGTAVGSPGPGRSGVIAYKNGWYRVWLSLTKGSGASIELRLVPQFNASFGGARDDTLISGSVYFWGAQVEVGDGVTSYIPTGAGPVSRQADFVDVITPAGFNAATSSVLVEAMTESPTTKETQGLFSFAQSGPDIIALHYDGPNKQAALFADNATIMQADYSGGLDWPAKTFKWFGMSYDNGPNEYNLASFGSHHGTDPGTIPAVDRFFFGRKGNIVGSHLNGVIRKVEYYNGPLSPGQMITGTLDH